MNRKNWVAQTDCRDCKVKAGDEHESDCLLRKRTVVVDFTIRTVQAVPEDSDYSEIEFKYNESSWCSDNLLDELIRRRKETGRCLCLVAEAQCIREATEQDEDDYGFCFVNELKQE